MLPKRKYLDYKTIYDEKKNNLTNLRKNGRNRISQLYKRHFLKKTYKGCEKMCEHIKRY